MEVGNREERSFGFFRELKGLILFDKPLKVPLCEALKVCVVAEE